MVPVCINSLPPSRPARAHAAAHPSHRAARLALGVGLAAAALAAGAGVACAQTVVVVQGGPAFSPAQRAYVEGYVVRHPVPPAPIPGGYVARVGGYIPAGVPLRTFDTYNEGYADAGYRGGYGPYGGPYGGGYGGYGATYGAVGEGLYDGGYPAGAAGGYGLEGYRYVVMPGNTAAVVEPTTRRIILIIE